MKSYKWKAGSRCCGDVQRVGDFLEDLRAKHNGMLTAEIVVKAAKAKRSPLHSYFEWDDSAAASMYRDEQARGLIRSVSIVWEASPDSVKVIRAFVHIQGVGSAYTSTIEALSDSGMREYVLKQAYEELLVVQRKYADLEELSEVFQKIGDFGKSVAA